MAMQMIALYSTKNALGHQGRWQEHSAGAGRLDDLGCPSLQRSLAPYKYPRPSVDAETVRDKTGAFRRLKRTVVSRQSYQTMLALIE